MLAPGFCDGSHQLLRHLWIYVRRKVRASEFPVLSRARKILTVERHGPCQHQRLHIAWIDFQRLLNQGFGLSLQLATMDDPQGIGIIGK